jgi:hypothetical protein
MDNIEILNSKIIDVDNIPLVPNIGYYNKNIPYINAEKDNPNTNSYGTIASNIKKNCSGILKEGIYNNIPNELKNIKDIKNIDVPYYLGKIGKLNQADLNTAITNDYNTNSSLTNSANQIKYLVCQLINARNRYYNPSDFAVIMKSSTLSGTFEKFGKKLVLPLSLIFIITMYFLVSGLFSSIDVTSSIINIIQNKGEKTSVSYWLGILIGVLIPITIITITYKYIISNNLKNLEKDNITDNPYGTEDKNKSIDVNIDYTTMSLFVLFIYILIAVLFTINASSFSNIFYSLSVSFILILIAILIYVMYYFIPFFNTADIGKLYSSEQTKLELYVDVQDPLQQSDVSNITTNQTQNTLLQKVFLITGIIILVLAIIFFSVFSKSSGNENTFFKSFMKGIFGTSAILVVPILWVFNIIIALQYFYVYPIFLIIVRYFRYVLMMILYLKNKKINPSYSDDLSKTLSNFQNYSAPWGLIGIEELKIVMGLFGHDNLFSDSIISSNNNSSNISNNKFISSGLLGFFAQDNKSGIAMSILFMLVTLIISGYILFGIVKIQNFFK